MEKVGPAAPALQRLERAWFDRHVQRLKDRYNASLYRAFGGVIQAGPFRGMTLDGETSWGDDLGMMLAGQYEREVMDLIARTDFSAYDAVVDVGCANGLFAVGMARLRPDWRVIAFDISEDAQRTTRRNAERNGVADRLDVRGGATPDALQAALEPIGRPFVIVDVEGYEAVLVDPAAVPGLTKADVLIELHDRKDDAITDLIEARCTATHAVERIERGWRDPFALEQLRRVPDLHAWIVASENRTNSSRWLMLRSRSTAA